MQHLDLLQTLTAGLCAALALGYLAHRVGLSPIVGYLLAGVAVGPTTPGFVANHELASQLAEVGVILLMFGVGLHFHLEELLEVRRIALPGAMLQCTAAALLGMLVGVFFGWGWSGGLVFGLAVSVASTVVLTRVLSDADELHTPAGNIAIGWLVVQDIFAVIVLVLLPEIFGSTEPVGFASVASVFLRAIGKISVLVAVVMLGGGRLIPWLLRHVAAARSRELFTLTVLAVALGIAVGSARLFGVSMALGAFLAGMVVGRSDFSTRAATEALPMRDAFAVLFFVSVGMLFDPGFLIRSPGLVIATLAVVLLGTPAATLLVVLARRYPFRIAATLALALAQIGEFSFMLAEVGRRLGLLGESAMHALVAVAILSIAINPLLHRLVSPLNTWVSRQPRIARWLAARARDAEQGSDHVAQDPTLDPLYRAVVVGYGPVGRTLARLLRENGVEPTVVELNLETVNRLRAQGRPAVYGDASHLETLRQAGVARAATLILTSSDTRGGPEVIRHARELNPPIRILVRAGYLKERAALLKAGASAAFASEGEVALAMVESVLTTLGATPEQIDRERAQVRSEFFGRDDPIDTRPLPAPPTHPLPSQDAPEATESVEGEEATLQGPLKSDGDPGWNGKSIAHDPPKP